MLRQLGQEAELGSGELAVPGSYPVIIEQDLEGARLAAVAVVGFA